MPVILKTPAFHVPPGFDAFFDVVVGLLYGLGSEVGADDVLSCANEGYNGVYKLVEAFMHVAYGTGLDVLIGVEDASEGISHLTQAAFECQAALQINYEHLITLYQTAIEYPQEYAMTLAWTLWKRGNMPYKHAQDVYTSYGQYDWNGMGLHAGKLVAAIVFDN
ncbi:MAG: hypothetical protein V2I33_22645 [Kangiellaceae bacterium]|jgi:hypothetical protein|nr:hypothetical protein [Kangiellaceae bacterium]